MKQNISISSDSPIRIAISSCLLGEKVRFDGQDKLDYFIAQTLGKFFAWIPVCPEFELGLGVPREPIQLMQSGDSVSLLTVHSRKDLTNRMRAFAASRVHALAEERISGYILKSHSPSCGLARILVHRTGARSLKSGRGLFAQTLLSQIPNLPVEEESRFSNLTILENWIQRVFAYNRLQQLCNSHWTIRSLQMFHANNKLALMAHSPKICRDLGRLSANSQAMSRQELRFHYEAEYMRAFSSIATKGKIANALQHAAGYFKILWDDKTRREFASLVDDYREERIPISKPRSVLGRYIHNIPYLADQTFLRPTSRELALESAILERGRPAR